MEPALGDLSNPVKAVVCGDGMCTAAERWIKLGLGVVKGVTVLGSGGCWGDWDGGSERNGGNGDGFVDR